LPPPWSAARRASRPNRHHRAELCYLVDLRDVLRRSKCAAAMQYVPELTWILFLRVNSLLSRKILPVIANESPCSGEKSPC
jgi:hypothetical protein